MAYFSDSEAFELIKAALASKAIDLRGTHDTGIGQETSRGEADGKYLRALLDALVKQNTP